MSDTAVVDGASAPEVLSEQQWLDKRRQERAQPAKEPEPAPDPEPETELAESDPDPEVEVEAEADDVTREAELQSEAGDADPEGEAEPELSEDDTPEFPGTVRELAESLEFDPSDLAEHLTMTVTPNGKSQEVTLAEMAKGYMREADYTRDKMALAEKNRQFDEDSKQALERQNAAIQQLDTVAMALAQEIDQGPSDAELERVKQEDRFRYYDLMEQRNKRLQAFQQAQAMRQKVQQDAEQEGRQKVLKYRKEQQDRLAERVPEMRDASKANAFEESMRSFLTSPEIGYTEDEVTAFINGPFDHRNVLVIRKAVEAVEAEKVQTRVKKKAKKLPKVRSGARRTDAQRQGDQMRSAKATLRRDQSTEAGLALLKARRILRRNATHGGSQ